MVEKEVQNGQVQPQDPAGLLSEIPPSLVPRLGDYLLHHGLITAEDLQSALNYQSSKSTQGNPVPLGQALLELGLIDRDTLDRAILRQSLSLQAALEEANRTLENRVQSRTQDLENRLMEIQTAAEITQLASTSNSQQELLEQVVQLLVDRFNFYLVSIFSLNERESKLVLAAAAGKASDGQAAARLVQRGLHIDLDSRSMVAFTASENQPRLATDVSDEFLYLSDDFLPETHSEVSIPISIGSKVFGVLDVQQSKRAVEDSGQPFEIEMVTVLQMIATHMAANVRNFRLLENAQANLSEAATLFQASHQISRADSREEVLAAAGLAVAAANIPAVFLSAEGSLLRVRKVRRISSDEANYNLEGQCLQASRQDFEAQFNLDTPVMILDFDHGADYPGCLTEIPWQMDWKVAGYIPIWQQDKIDALLVFGANASDMLNQSILRPYAVLGELTSIALTKLSAQRIMERRLEALQTFSKISQVVSLETDIEDLYKVIHQEVTRLMGEVDFLIATYDPPENKIQIPYMYESGTYLKYEPFPLGEGLTSILINTRQPLMLVENTEIRAKELGAKVLGKPAKSWLGVPLLVSGEVIGAIIVQDLEHEFRFDEDDQRILSTLASQVAIAIRNARLLENMHMQAERERLLYQITSKIRAASDMQTILEITAEELSKALKARRAEVKIGLDED